MDKKKSEKGKDKEVKPSNGTKVTELTATDMVMLKAMKDANGEIL